MKTLTELLAIKNDRVSIIGCGGKTSCMEVLAAENREQRLLATTTTKIRLPQTYDYLLSNQEQILAHVPQTGVQYMGILKERTGKLQAMESGLLATLEKGYDTVLMEADGSRGLPLKGWADFEPVVPVFTTKTVGIVTLQGLGKKANAASVHRLKEFLKITEIEAESIVTLDDICKMITRGMFQKAVKEKILIINQIDIFAGADYQQAAQLATLVHRDAGCGVNKIIIGSMKNKAWTLFKN